MEDGGGCSQVRGGGEGERVCGMGWGGGGRENPKPPSHPLGHPFLPALLGPPPPLPLPCLTPHPLPLLWTSSTDTTVARHLHLGSRPPSPTPHAHACPPLPPLPLQRTSSTHTAVVTSLLAALFLAPGYLVTCGASSMSRSPPPLRVVWCGVRAQGALYRGEGLGAGGIGVRA